MKLHGKHTAHNSQYFKKVMVLGAATKSHEAICTSKPGYVDKRITCGVCQKKYNSDNILKNDMRTIHCPPVGSFKCDHCVSDKFTRLNSLKEHIKGCEKIQTGVLLPGRRMCIQGSQIFQGEEQEHPHEGPRLLTCFQIEVVNWLIHSTCVVFSMGGWTSGPLYIVFYFELYYYTFIVVNSVDHIHPCSGLTGVWTSRLYAFVQTAVSGQFPGQVCLCSDFDGWIDQWSIPIFFSCICFVF